MGFKALQVWMFTVVLVILMEKINVISGIYLS
jgi:hypothetical protein